jgi:hypothetical protein
MHSWIVGGAFFVVGIDSDDLLVCLTKPHINAASDNHPGMENWSLLSLVVP